MQDSQFDAKQLAYWNAQTRRRRPDDPIVAAFARPKIQFLLRHVTLAPHAHILDIGCGNGYLMHHLKRLGVTVGLDNSSTMLRLNPCSNLFQGSALHLPFANSSFDLVTCSNLLHHLSDPSEVLAEMRRVSSRYVAVFEPNPRNPAMLVLSLLKKEEHQVLRHSVSFLSALARAVGLKPLAGEIAGFVTPNRMPRIVAMLAARLEFPNPFAAYIMLLTEKIPAAIIASP